jgi:hypothetical protein
MLLFICQGLDRDFVYAHRVDARESRSLKMQGGFEAVELFKRPLDLDDQPLGLIAHRARESKRVSKMPDRRPKADSLQLTRKLDPPALVNHG